MDLARTLDALGVITAGDEPLPGAMSGATVVAGTRAGRAVVVKIVPLTSDLDRARSERELAMQPRLGGLAPRLLDQTHVEERSVLVFERLVPPPPADQWGDQDWMTLVDLLVRVHSSPTDGLVPLPPPDLLLPDDPEVVTFLPDEDDQRLLASALAALDPADSLPPTLVHGDCHVDNVVLDEDSMVLADWAESGLGDPARDLAFVLARATPVGARPPVEAMLDRYAGARGLDRALVERAVRRQQFEAIALQYPLYLPYLSHEAVERLREEFRALAGRIRT
ncbi:phosphotransferase family protein [Aestuariimicrobium ganziense]|uniref:phosphotransferase family protein n=1 Tax=Aestuariimicrobium ganziense TaxID=2773677 RepID=UPI001943E4C3|nr:aminoglycoside phosphotransferase family protein [Aestuariimicrobium ganziense]